MTGETDSGGARRDSRWRIAVWSAAALVLLIPLIAMPSTGAGRWGAGDVVLAAVFSLSLGIPFELVVRKTGDTAYRAGVGVALMAAFLLVWLNGAVGILGSEDNDANLLYGGVLAVGFVSALLARFRPRGMTAATTATALAQTAITAGALVGGWAGPGNGVFEVVALNGIFIALWAGSAALFRRASLD